MKILGIDTSSRASSLSIVEEGVVLARHEELHEHPPSDLAFVLLDELLDRAGLAANDLDAFAACLGPGSFTGLRVGLAMAKTFAWALDRPVFGYDAVRLTAERALRHGAAAEGEEFAALFFAQRGTVFAGRYRALDGRTEPLGELIWADSLEEARPALEGSWPPLVQDGDGVPETLELRRVPREPSAAELVARLAAGDLSRGEIPEFHAVQPRYLKPFSVGRKPRTMRDSR